MTKAVALVLLFVALVALVACGAKRKDWRSKPLSVAGEKVWVLEGKIVARNASERDVLLDAGVPQRHNSVRVDHEAILGFMESGETGGGSARICPRLS